MDNPGRVLIVASSGRMLTQAAHQAGYEPFVIDLYADGDTRDIAQACIPIPSLGINHLAPALTRLLADYRISQAIYGSGFENHPKSLSYLDNTLQLLGNSPAVFANISNKVFFFSTLEELAIPYPTTTFVQPENGPIPWLEKPLHGQGGIGIRSYRPTTDQRTGIYWQQAIEGTAHSVLFLADGKQAHIIGFNRQWSIPIGDNRFVFSGIINDGAISVSAAHKSLITHWLAMIIPIFNLKGLNSLDFIATQNQCHVLEINARPPASMQLYGNTLFNQHIDACLGQLPNTPFIQRGYMGYQIVYAQRNTLIPNRFNWPPWCKDLPDGGALINTEQPICSMIASAKQPQQVIETLMLQQQLLIDQLHKGMTHGI